MDRYAVGPVRAPMPEPLARDVRYGWRALRRTPRFTGAALLALALGIGMGVALFSLVERGLSHPHAVESPEGITVPTAAATTDRPGPSSLERFFGAGAGWGSARQSVAEVQRSSLRYLLRTLGGTGVLALGVASLNLALLLLARATARRREVALRGVLGATRPRLLRQLLTEGALLGALGAVLGLIVGAAGVEFLRGSWPAGLAPWLRGPVPAAAIALAVGVPGLTVLLFSLAPVLAAREGRLHAVIAGGGRGTAGTHEGALRRRLTIAAVAGSLVLLTGSGLLLRSFDSAASPDGLGFDPSDTLTMELRLPEERLAGAQERGEYLQALLGRVAAVPGVEAQSLASPGAWVGLGTRDLAHALTGEPTRPGIVKPAQYHAVGPGYFRALGAPVLRGREFTAGDAAGSPAVVVVSEAFAHRLLPGIDPLGKQVQVGGMSLGGTFYTIVGVVGDVRLRGIGSGSIPVPAVYLPALQVPPAALGLAVRTTGDPVAALPAVERALRSVDPALTVARAMTMEERLARFAAPLGWTARLSGALAALAVLLATFGLYGVVSYSVAQRTRELGVRAALGARPWSIVGLVVGEGLRLTAAGAAVGVAGALCLARLLQYLFYGVDPLDPLVYGAAAALLGGVALLASYGPARAAARVDPMLALRED